MIQEDCESENISGEPDIRVPRTKRWIVQKTVDPGSSVKSTGEVGEGPEFDNGGEPRVGSHVMACQRVKDHGE